MKLETIINKIHSSIESGTQDQLLEWFKKHLEKEPDSVDLHYWHLEALANSNLDGEHETEELLVLNRLGTIVRNKSDYDVLTVAKAYAYQGEIRYAKPDRQKYFDKAKAILMTLDQKHYDVRYLCRFIDEYYHHEIRKLIYFNTNNQGMFTQPDVYHLKK
jgi:hypothetical protein